MRKPADCERGAEGSHLMQEHWCTGLPSPALFLCFWRFLFWCRFINAFWVNLHRLTPAYPPFSSYVISRLAHLAECAFLNVPPPQQIPPRLGTSSQVGITVGRSEYLKSPAILPSLRLHAQAMES